MKTRLIKGLLLMLMVITLVETINPYLLSATTSTVENEESTEEITENLYEEENNELESTTDNEDAEENVDQESTEIEISEDLNLTDKIDDIEQDLLRGIRSTRSVSENGVQNYLQEDEMANAFIVFFEDDNMDLYANAYTVFENSAGKAVLPEINALTITKESEEITDESFVQQITSLPNVSLVEKNELISAQEDMVPNDRYYASDQWEMRNLNMPTVWDYGNGSGTRVGIFDTGFSNLYNKSNPEFNHDRIKPITNYGDNSCYSSSANHGTTVAAVAGAAATNNNQGIASVAYGSTIYPYMVGVNCSGGSFSFSVANYVQVMNDVINDKIDVLNMSFGGGSISAAQTEAQKRAQEKGVILVASRGNAGTKGAQYPACSSGVIMSGAINSQDESSYFSSYGDCSNAGNLLVTYGENISTISSNANALSADGTSYSAPITTGVIAVLKSISPSASNQEIIKSLKETSKDLGTIGYDQVYGHGAIQPLEAMKRLLKGVLVKGNIIYYLNSDLTIKSAEEKEAGTGKIKGYMLFYANTKYGNNHLKNIRYIFSVNPATQDLTKSEEREQGTGKTKAYITYYPNTKYGNNHVKNMKYLFYVDPTTQNLIKSEEREQNTGKIKAYITYYANTKYGNNHVKNMKYLFYVDPTTQNLIKSEEREQNTGKIKTYITYYPNTKYGNTHVKNMKYLFYVDPVTQSLIKSEEREQNTGKIKAYITYYANTKYGNNHVKNMKYLFIVDPNTQYISRSEEREQGTGKVKAYIEYYANTKYGNDHNKRIKEVFTIKDGYIAYSIERNTVGKQVKKHLYYDNTKYGFHKNRIRQTINL